MFCSSPALYPILVISFVYLVLYLTPSVSRLIRSLAHGYGQIKESKARVSNSRPFTRSSSPFLTYLPEFPVTISKILFLHLADHSTSRSPPFHFQKRTPGNGLEGWRCLSGYWPLFQGGSSPTLFGSSPNERECITYFYKIKNNVRHLLSCLT